jgi:hypothetical protein
VWRKEEAARSVARAAVAAQRAEMYIVISKPKRRSWYWGVVQAIVSLLVGLRNAVESGEGSTARGVPMVVVARWYRVCA